MSAICDPTYLLYSLGHILHQLSNLLFYQMLVLKFDIYASQYKDHNCAILPCIYAAGLIGNLSYHIILIFQAIILLF